VSESEVCIKMVVLLCNYITIMNGQQYIKLKTSTTCVL
jgi:hypothetical protein